MSSSLTCLANFCGYKIQNCECVVYINSAVFQSASEATISKHGQRQGIESQSLESIAWSAGLQDSNMGPEFCGLPTYLSPMDSWTFY